MQTADAASLKLALHEKDAMLRQAAVNKALRDIEVRQRPAEDLREYAELLQLQMAIEVNDVVAAQSGTNPHMVVSVQCGEIWIG